MLFIGIVPTPNIFRGTTLCVLESANPTSGVLINLVHASGAKVCEDAVMDVDYVVFGECLYM